MGVNLGKVSLIPKGELLKEAEGPTLHLDVALSKCNNTSSVAIEEETVQRWKNKNIEKHRVLMILLIH